MTVFFAFRLAKKPLSLLVNAENPPLPSPKIKIKKIITAATGATEFLNGVLHRQDQTNPLVIPELIGMWVKTFVQQPGSKYQVPKLIMQ